MNKVSVVKCITYNLTELKEQIQRCCDLVGGLQKYIKKGDRVLLKPNFLMAKPPESAVTTHPNFIAAVCELISDIGVASIIIGDSSGIGNSLKVAKTLKLFPMVEKYNAKIVNFEESKTIKADGLFKKFEVSNIVDSVDKIINLPKIKTHAQLYLTCAVKNNFGFVVGKRKPEWHFRIGFDFDYFARMICELAIAINPTFNICDGIVAMEGNGPTSGQAKELGLILAGSDPFSIDYVISKLLGLDNKKNLVLKVARQMNIIDEMNIEIVGDRVEITHIKPPTVTLSTTWGIPKFAKRILKRSLTSKPFIEKDVCKSCNICKEHCPTGAIFQKNGGLKIDQNKCIRCFCCQEFCPECAVIVKNGLILTVMNHFKK